MKRKDKLEFSFINTKLVFLCISLSLVGFMSTIRPIAQNVKHKLYLSHTCAEHNIVQAYISL